MLNKNSLKAEIVRQGLTQKQVAEAIGISEKTFISRMKSGVFGTDEVEVMINLLKIKDPMSIFFAEQVTQQVTKKEEENGIHKRRTF